MGKVHELIRQAIAKLERDGENQSEIATRCHLSQPTIHKYINSEPEPSRTTLKKFSHGLGIPLQDLLAAEGLAHYGTPKDEPIPMPSHITALIDLLKQLDKEEVLTLKRCAEAFTQSSPDVRQHLIGQLKIIERLMQHELGTGPPHHKVKGAD